MKTRSNRKRLIFIFFTLVSLLALGSVTPIFYPQMFQCNRVAVMSQFKIYSCGKSDLEHSKSDRVEAVLSRVHELIKKSEYFDPDYRFKVFVRESNESKKSLPFQFPEKAYGQTIPLFSNVFISNADFKLDTAINGAGHFRPLSSIIAHELIHVLIENKYGLLRIRYHQFITDSMSRTSLGLFWKEEGYAEYIAEGQAIALEDGLEILAGKVAKNYTKYEIEYFRCWLAIKYLIEVEHRNFNQIWFSIIDFKEILNRAEQYYGARSRKG